MSKYIFFIIPIFLFVACQEKEQRSDAYGNFEATTILVSSEAKGELLFLDVEEGKRLQTGQLVGLVDTTQLHLQRQQIRASIGTLPQKLRSSLQEIEVLKEQKANLIRERDRVKRLLEKKAATPKQLDDLNGEIEVVEQRIKAIEEQTQTANRAILAEKEPMLAQIDLINEQIRQSYIYNPVAGTVLTKLAEPSEIVGFGAPLYRIGRLDTMTLRAYISGVQLQQIQLGQEIEVLIDEGEEGYQTFTGTISWIASEAEFTPKTIQTKEERVNLVYAIEAKVPNPGGRLKIGMPAELNFGVQPQEVASQEQSTTNKPTTNN